MNEARLTAAIESYVDATRALVEITWPDRPDLVAPCLADARGYVGKAERALTANGAGGSPRWYDSLGPLIAGAQSTPDFEVLLGRGDQERSLAWSNPRALAICPPDRVGLPEVATLIQARGRLLSLIVHSCPGASPRLLATMVDPLADVNRPGAGWLDPGDWHERRPPPPDALPSDLVPTRLDASLRRRLRSYVADIVACLPSDREQSGLGEPGTGVALAGVAVVLAEYALGVLARTTRRRDEVRRLFRLIEAGLGPPGFLGTLGVSGSWDPAPILAAHRELRYWARQRVGSTWPEVDDVDLVPIKDWEAAVEVALSNPDGARALEDWLAEIREAGLRAGLGDRAERQAALFDQPAVAPGGHLPNNARDVAVMGVLSEIDAMLGAQPLKDHSRRVVALHRADERRRRAGLHVEPVSRHLVLVGNPGTGKTTAARLLASLYRHLGILPKGHLVEVGRADLVAQYVGQTAVKTRKVLDAADGGVLFIDEAYSLQSDGPWDFGHEAIDVLVQEMENRRKSLVVMAAGYRADMESFLASNEGLRGRFATTLDFPDLSDAALVTVAEQFLHAARLDYGDDVPTALLRAVARMPRGRGFANARAARSLVDETRARQADRVAALATVQLQTVIAADVPGGDPRELGRQRDDDRVRYALQQLDDLVGLGTVKEAVNDLVAVARMDRLRAGVGLEPGGVLGHFVFLGNPGTGKTSVARLIGEVFAGLGLLDSGHTVECGRSDLVAQYVGQTAAKTTAKVQEAEGGVLFIDEAYSLAPPDARNDFGREAVDTLVQLMENRRGRFVCILAGYPEPMNRLMDLNPGLPGRITHRINFPDYTTGELTEVLASMAAQRDFIADAEFLDKAEHWLDAARLDADFANARTARELLDHAIRQHARRVAAFASADADPDMLRRLRAEDLPEPTEPIQRDGFGFVP